METKKPHFVSRGLLAKHFNLCLNTFNKELDYIKDQIPLYRDKQRIFSPAQVKVIMNLWGGLPE